MRRYCYVMHPILALAYGALLHPVTVKSAIETCLVNRMPIRSLSADGAYVYTTSNSDVAAIVFFKQQCDEAIDLIALSSNHTVMMKEDWIQMRGELFSIPNTYGAFENLDEWRQFYTGATILEET